MNLVDYIGDFNIEYPGAFCVYTPLATMSLTDLINSYQTDLQAMIKLAADYLKGLTYLHEEKGVMHRDMNPNNLGIKTINPASGVILDMDAATRVKGSNDHMQGTLMYLAPEITAWKERKPNKHDPPLYGRAVDVWALGLSMFSMHQGQLLSWGTFRTAPEARAKMVNQVVYNRFAERLQQEKHESPPVEYVFLDAVDKMTCFKSESRQSAGMAFARMEPHVEGGGLISPKTTAKRHVEAVQLFEAVKKARD